MAFRFPLDTVLRLRQNLERQELLRLQQANQHVTGIAAHIAQLNRALTEGAKQQVEQLDSGLTGAEMQFQWVCRSVLLESRTELEQKLIAAQRARDVQAEVFRIAHQQRETIETLRRRRLQLYRLYETRREQREADDLFLQRRTLRG